MFDVFGKQKELLKYAIGKNSMKINIVIYGGAIRGGKTMGGAILGGILCTWIAGYKWYVVRATQHRLVSTTIPSYNAIFDEAKGVDHKNKTIFKIPFLNGSQIIFMPESFTSDKELNRFRGLEANGFHLDEFNELQENTFNKCVERAGANIVKSLGKKKQPKPFILATCNPTQNWVKKRFYDNFKTGSLPENTKFIQAKIFDNPNIPEQYTTHLRETLTPLEYETFVNGNWEIMARSGFEFYKSFKIEKHVGIFEYQKSLPLWISLDENVNPYLSCSVWQVCDDAAFAVDELCLKNPRNNLFEICKDLREKYRGHDSGIFITGDSTSLKRDVKLSQGSNFYTIIEKELAIFNPQIKVADSNPPVVTRGVFINRIFSGKSDVKIYVDDKCKNLIIDLQNLKEKGDGTKLKEKETKDGITYEKLGHLSDTLDYFVCQVFKKEFQNFMRGDVVPISVVPFVRRVRAF